MKKELTLTLVFLAVLLLSSICIIISFPKENEYQTTADEGGYYRQATKINEQGLRGFETLAKEYIEKPDLQVYPSPARIGYLFLASLALKISYSFHALSMLNVLFFILQVLASFFFLRRHWGIKVAVIVGILICASPLSWALSKRALSDPALFLFLSLSLFTFIDFLRRNKMKSCIQFILVFAFSILIKENAILLLPFFGLMLLVHKFYYKKDINIFSMGAMIIGPLVVCITAYMLVLGSLHNALEIARIINKLSLATPPPYVVRYHSGPWYQIFIDLFLLSPFVSIFCMLYVGYYFIGTERKDEPLNLLLLFSIYFIMLYSFLPKNVRWAIPVDMIFRICAGLLIIHLYETINAKIRIRKTIPITLMFLILYTNVKSYYNYFIRYDIYDPTSFNLLVAERVFFGVGELPLEESYLRMSLYYYNKGWYFDCIKEAQNAIIIKPDCAEAYNNICSSYNQMKDWDHAIEAGKKAVEINPNLQLLKNNLNWAINQKELGK